MVVLLAFLVRFAVDPWLGDQDPYIVFIVAIAVTGLFAGSRPALLASAVAIPIAYFGFVQPRYRWGFDHTSDAADFAVFLLAAAAIILLTQARIRASARAESSLRAQMEAERKLLDAHALFRLFMDNSPACAYLRDQAGLCVYANAIAKHELGIDPDSAATQAPVPPEWQEQDRRVLTENRPIEFLDRLPRGAQRDWLTSKFPFVDSAGRKFVGAISFEITERVRAEEVLRSTERLSAAGQMASLLAHEINNPLAALTNLLYLMEQQALTPAGREFLKHAHHALARLNRIARVTFDISSETDSPAPINICAVIDEVAELLNSQAGNHARIVRDFRDNATIVASPTRARQLIASLLINALEAGARTVRIRVRAGHDWRTHRAGINITLSDDGRGIARELRQRVFDPFFTTKPEKGAGLGLWASQTIVLRNKGLIRLRSTAVGAVTGTCVRVFLPGEFDRAAYETQALRPTGT